MNEFLVQLQAILDSEASKGNINKSIERIQNQINKLSIKTEIDPKSILNIKRQIEKLTNQKIELSNFNVDAQNLGKVGKQAGEQIGKQFSQGISNVLNNNSNILESFRNSLKNIGMNSKEIDTVANKIKSLGIQIESLNQKHSDGKKNILSVDVKGIDKYGQAIKLTQQYKFETGELIKTINAVSTIQQKQFSEIDKNYTNYLNKLSNLQTKYSKASIDYSGFEKSLEKFKNGEITINELSKAFNVLENSAKRGIQSLKSQTSSFDPITQTINNMRDFPSMLQKLEAGMDGVKNKTSLADVVIEDLYKDYQNLQNTMSNNGGKVPLTEEWTSKYQNLMSTVASATKQVEALKKAEASDNSQTAKQSGYYSEILSNYRQIYSLKKKLLTAGQEESKVIENQLRSLNAANAENYKQLNRQGLTDNNWQNEVDSLKKSLDYTYQISVARQNDKNIAREQVQAEKERLVLLESQKNAIANQAKGKAKTTALQEASQQKEINSILSKQQNAYKQIWNIKKQIATLDPSQNENQISALNEKKRNYQEIFLAAQKELQAYNNISISQEHLHSLSEIRKRTESEIAVAIAKQTETKANKIQFQVDTGGYESKVESLISRTKQWTDGNGNARISTDALKQSLDKLNAASAKYADNKTIENRKRLIEADKEWNRQVNIVTNSVRKMNAELAKDSTVSSLHNKIQSFYDQNTAAHGRWGAQLKQMLSKTASGAKLTTEQVRAIEQAFNGVTSAAQRAGKVGKSWFQTLKESTKIFSAWTSPAAIIMRGVSEVKQAVSEMKDLDNILTEISKTSGVARAELEDLGMSAYDSASKYGRTATDYLSGVQEMARSGFYGDKGTAMAEQSLLAQAAGDMSADLANNYVLATNAAYKFNGEAEKINAVIDGQNMVCNRNSVAMAEMAAGMSKAGTVASSYNVSVEDLSAMIGTMEAVTKSGGEEIGNGIKSILINLQNVTSDKIVMTLDKANASMTEFVNGTEKLRNPIDILRDLAKTFNQLDEDDPLRAEILTNIGQKYQAAKFGALLNNMDMFDKMLVDYSEGAGSAMVESEKSANNLTGTLNKLSNSWTELVNTFVNADGLINIVNVLNNLLQSVTNIVDKIGSFGTIGLGAGLFAGIKNVGRWKNVSPICYLF